MTGIVKSSGPLIGLRFKVPICSSRRTEKGKEALPSNDLNHRLDSDIRQNRGIIKADILETK